MSPHPNPSSRPFSLAAPWSPTLTRRSLLAALGVAVISTSACSGSRTVSSDPSTLSLWYWTRSISEKLLNVARQQIPGTAAHLSTDAISNIDIKLRTSLAGGSYIPDITGINSNVSIYFPSEDEFVDLNDLGAASLKGDYFPWKWQFGTTPTGRMCFFPMDTGPTALFYRTDLFEKAGLPADPDEVQKAVKDWASYIEVGKQLKAKAGTLMETSTIQIFNQWLYASDQRFFDSADTPIFAADGSSVRQAWQVATQAAKAGITGKGLDWTSGNAAVATGSVGAHIEAVWWGPILKDTAPKTAGKWQVCQQPVRAGNSGGSFLAIPKACKDPSAAYRFITWLNTPQNQVKSFADIQLFPSCPKSLESKEMAVNDPFFSGQNLTSIFYDSAKQVLTTYFSPLEAAVTTAFTDELTNVEVAGKDPDAAWSDAVATANRQLNKKGVQA